MPIFVNLSNHPIETWTAAQVQAVRVLGYEESRELEGGFPTVNPEASGAEVGKLARQIAERVEQMGARGAHVAGEPVLSACLVRELISRKIRCFAATTARVSNPVSKPDGSVVTERVFRFVQWREYPSE